MLIFAIKKGEGQVGLVYNDGQVGLDNAGIKVFNDLVIKLFADFDSFVAF